MYGDANGDGVVDIDDVVALIEYIFVQGDPPDPSYYGDCNGDSLIDIDDVVYLISYIFTGGHPPQNFQMPINLSDVVFDSLNGVYMVPNRLVIQFVDGTSNKAIDSLIELAGGVAVREIRELLLYAVEVSDTSYSLQVLRGSGVVDFAYPTVLVPVAAVTKPTDPYFIAYQQIGYLQVRAQQGWTISVPPNCDVMIAVIDIKINEAHPDLVSRITSKRLWASSYDDNADHGTWVTGLAAASPNNMHGVSGTDWHSDLMIIRSRAIEIGSSQGCEPFEAMYGIYEAVKLAEERGKHIVINLSVGNEVTFRPPADIVGEIFKRAVQWALDKGAFMVAASGNTGSGGLEISKGWPFEGNGNRVYPASLPGVLAVGAVTKTDSRSTYSNFGTEVLAAPDYLYTTVGLDGYGNGSGTSLAAPVVTGAAALIWCQHPELSAEDLRNLLVQSSDNVISSGTEFGFGRLNISRALELASGNPLPPEDKLPSQPGYFVAVPGNELVALSWESPIFEYDGSPLGDNIVGYHIYRKESSLSDVTWIQLTNPNLPYPETYFEDNEVVNGTQYSYRVSAVDGGGQEGYWSEIPVIATPNSEPIFDFLVAGEQPSWSPDGLHLAYSAWSVFDTAFNIYTTAISGGEPSKITNYTSHLGSARGADWSPDGDVIAFTRVFTGSESDVYVIAVSGGEPQELTNAQGVDTHPDWSPDATDLVFSTTRAGYYQVYTMTSSGESQDMFADGYFPAWSPDGSRIAFAAFVTSRSHADIYVKSISTGVIEQLTTDPQSDNLPTWSPDGTMIAYVHDSDIIIMDSRGEAFGKINLTGSHVVCPCTSPDWSPDGARIAFGGIGGIWIASSLPSPIVPSEAK